jgi:hypothetical protein
MELAGRGPPHWTVRDAVDHQAAHPADPFSAVVIERDRNLVPLGEALIDYVEHLEEGHVRADVSRVVSDHLARRVGTCLSPDMKGEIHHL